MSAPLHRLDLALPGTFAGAQVVCLGTDEHICRQWCAEPGSACEEGCAATPVLWPATVELVAQAPTGEHQWKPYGSCREAEWINNCGVEDCHGDEHGFPFDEDGEAQLGVRSGLIEIEWTGDDYIWFYAEDAPPVDQPVPDGQLALEVSS